MKAVGLYRPLPITDPDSLVDLQVDEPTIGARDLLVEVRAISVNPVDYKMRSKGGTEASPKILGWDASGVVRAIGPEVLNFSVGDAVYYAGAIDRQGCNSELHAVDERVVGHMPKTLSFAAAAAMPLTTLTAWEAMFDRLGIASRPTESQQSLLIIGGAGGVGSIAIQIAKRLTTLRVIATASRPASAQWVRDLGADEIIDHSQDIATQLEALGTPEVDYILCLSDPGAYFGGFAGYIKPQGAICLIVSTQHRLDLVSLMHKSATVAWEYMFTRPLFQTADLERQQHILEEAARLIDEGILRSTRAQNLGTISAANLRQAHALLEQGRTIGKIVLSGFD